jgi:glutathione S-transferase
VERARWALELANLPFSEDCYPPVVHMSATKAATSKGSSKGCPSTSVPVLITPDEGVLADSAHIIKYCHAKMGDASCLYPKDEAQSKEIDDIESLCASRLGVFARVVCYQYAIFTDGFLTVRALCDGVPFSRTLVFRSLFYVIVPLMKAGMKINKVNADVCLDKIEKIFTELGDRLTKSGGRYFVGDQFSAADLTFASMAALLVLPPSGYGTKLSELEGPLFKHPRIAALRETVAGKHCLRMYREHRMKSANSLSSKM